MYDKLKKSLQHVWRTYGSLNNLVLAAALVIAASWAWGSVSIMQTNFESQKTVDDSKRQLELMKLEVQTLEYQKNYYQSDEYKDLAARSKLGLASPGEKVLLLPENSEAIKRQDAADERSVQGATTPTTPTVSQTNFEQWMSFLSGNNAAVLQRSP